MTWIITFAILRCRNPAVSVQARRVMGHRQVADAQKGAITGWMEDVKYSHEVELCVNDMLFSRGVLMHFIEDDVRWSNGSVRPNVMRVDFRDWGCDSLSSDRKNNEFEYHSYWVDIDDLMADPDLLPEAAENIKPDNEMFSPTLNKLVMIDYGFSEVI